MNRGGSARSKKMKSLYWRIGDQGHEIELLPERIELAPARLVEDQRAERRVIAEVALHQVEAGGQEPALDGAAFGVEVGATLGPRRTCRGRPGRTPRCPACPRHRLLRGDRIRCAASWRFLQSTKG